MSLCREQLNFAPRSRDYDVVVFSAAKGHNGLEKKKNYHLALPPLPRHSLSFSCAPEVTLWCRLKSVRVAIEEYEVGSLEQRVKEIRKGIGLLEKREKSDSSSDASEWSEEINREEVLAGDDCRKQGLLFIGRACTSIRTRLEICGYCRWI